MRRARATEQPKKRRVAGVDVEVHVRMEGASLRHLFVTAPVLNAGFPGAVPDRPSPGMGKQPSPSLSLGHGALGPGAWRHESARRAMVMQVSPPHSTGSP